MPVRHSDWTCEECPPTPCSAYHASVFPNLSVCGCCTTQYFNFMFFLEKITGIRITALTLNEPNRVEENHTFFFVPMRA